MRQSDRSGLWCWTGIWRFIRGNAQNAKGLDHKWTYELYNSRSYYDRMAKTIVRRLWNVCEIYNEGRIWNNDSNYWKYYFNELPFHFNINLGHIQVGINCTIINVSLRSQTEIRYKPNAFKLWLADDFVVDIWLAESGILLASVWKHS